MNTSLETNPVTDCGVWTSVLNFSDLMRTGVTHSPHPPHNKMNNNQGKMDAQDALPPLIERVDQQLTPFSDITVDSGNFMKEIFWRF